MKKILYIRKSTEDRLEIIDRFEQQGYTIDEYDTACKTIGEVLKQEFYYFVISCGFVEDVCKACVETMTKYLIWMLGDSMIGFESRYVGNILNYYVCMDADRCDALKRKGAVHCYCLESEMTEENKIESFVLKKEEREIYETIGCLQIIHQNDVEPTITLKKLSEVEDSEEVLKKTELFFEKLENEKELSILLKEQLLSCINGLLEKGSWDAWREIVLWSNRHECKKLLNNFWQFFLLKKCVAIYSEETLQYYETGDIPSIIQIESFEELSKTYFKLLFLLRRLIYDVVPEDDHEVIDFIMEKRLSMVFVRHVVEHNQVEDKEKVYRRLEELLLGYE